MLKAIVLAPWFDTCMHGLQCTYEMQSAGTEYRVQASDVLFLQSTYRVTLYLPIQKQGSRRKSGREFLQTCRIHIHTCLFVRGVTRCSEVMSMKAWYYILRSTNSTWMSFLAPGQMCQGKSRARTTKIEQTASSIPFSMMILWWRDRWRIDLSNWRPNTIWFASCRFVLPPEYYYGVLRIAITLDPCRYQRCWAGVVGFGRMLSRHPITKESNWSTTQYFALL